MNSANSPNNEHQPQDSPQSDPPPKSLSEYLEENLKYFKQPIESYTRKERNVFRLFIIVILFSLVPMGFIYKLAKLEFAVPWYYFFAGGAIIIAMLHDRKD